MALGRRIACCLGLVAATFLLLGCGSSDSTSANIDPQISSDLTGQLDRIEAFFRDGNCDRATGAVDNLEKAVEDVSGQTGEQFTSDMKELVTNLGNQVADECEPPADTTTTSSTEETTESQPIVTEDTTPTETSSTTKPTTSSTSTTTSGTTSTPPPPPGNGPPVNPPGGGTPGGGINPSGKRHSSGPANKEPKPDKGHQHGGPGSKHGNEKEHGR
jgi:hypothetical protein